LIMIASLDWFVEFIELIGLSGSLVIWNSQI